jgi:aconitate hydratase
MGVLPLEYINNQTADSLRLDGTESFSIVINESLQPRQFVEVTALHKNGTVTTFETKCRIDTPVEVEYYRNGGILHTVLRKMATS